MLELIKEVIRECEGVQNSNESDYTKDCAKLSAYELIKEIVKGELDGSNTV